MKVTHEMVHDLVARFKHTIPGIEIKYKDESRWMAFIGFLVKPFNPRFMLTTLAWYPKIWFPSRRVVEAHPTGAAITVAHEAVHLWDSWREGPFWFRWSYIRPQVHALHAFIGFLLGDILAYALVGTVPWAVLVVQLLLIICAMLPWAAKLRRAYETRGYSMSFTMYRWLYGAAVAEAYAEETAELMAGSTYYFMGGPFADDTFKMELKAEIMRERAPYAVQVTVLQWTKDHGIEIKS